MNESSTNALPELIAVRSPSQSSSSSSDAQKVSELPQLVSTPPHSSHPSQAHAFPQHDHEHSYGLSHDSPNKVYIKEKLKLYRGASLELHGSPQGLGYHKQRQGANEQHEPPLLSPIRVISYNSFATHGEFPRNPEQDELTVVLDTIDRKNSLLIFISHCWLRGWSGAPGWNGRPHPDATSNGKYKLCVEGINKLWKSLAPGFKECYLWMDFGCMNQDGDPCGELKQLDKIMQHCDCVFTPILEENFLTDASEAPWELPAIIKDWYEDYKAEAWTGGPFSYLHRAWCRVEMFYASNIPLLSDDTDAEKERHKKMRHGLKFHCIHGVRPHLLYGTHNESNKGAPPTILPPLRNSYFEKYHPASGQLTMETDREKIVRLVEELKPFMTFEKIGYEGQLDANGLKQGRGVLVMGNGNLYVGEFLDDKFHGEGHIQGASGNYFIGIWENNFKKHGRYMYANGDSYVGEYANGGLRQGYGIESHASGLQYEGEWYNDKKHGMGKQVQFDPLNAEHAREFKVVYEGLWVEDVPVNTLAHDHREIEEHLKPPERSTEKHTPKTDLQIVLGRQKEQDQQGLHHDSPKIAEDRNSNVDGIDNGNPGQNIDGADTNKTLDIAHTLAPAATPAINISNF